MALNTKIFIERSMNKHGNKYDYSETDYTGIFNKLIIICSEHGKFLQTANDHLNGNGCQECAKINKFKKLDKVLEDFKKVHGNKYDYSKVIYKNSRTPIEIICPIHGSFFQQPNGHLSYGCVKCSNDKFRKNLDNVIKDFRKIHGYKYDYSKVSYKNNVKNIEIICLKHGSFFQSPLNHRNGAGCPKCKNSLGENKIRTYLEENNIEYIQEKTFKDCKFKKGLRFDFYLPNSNTIIEFDGEQHFKKVDHFGGEESFKNTRKRDFIKNEYCRNNNIPIIRIPYYYLNNIEEFLEYRL